MPSRSTGTGGSTFTGLLFASLESSGGKVLLSSSSVKDLTLVQETPSCTFQHRGIQIQLSPLSLLVWHL